jgi:sulfoxide reductase catalytic subunit YedY
MINSMMNKVKSAISENDVTPEEIFLNRRDIMKAAGTAAAILWTDTALAKLNPLYQVKDSDRSLTKEDLATSYNNYYEFSLEKGEVRKKVEGWKLKDPWTIEIGGLVEKPQTINLQDLIKLASDQEERIYRFRCVEAWSMVVPWNGFSLEKVIPKLKPKKEAKYIKFTSLSDSSQMPGIKSQPQYPWPYTEGLTMEEAMHPLSFFATGMYGKNLTKQNGAPIRLVVPWKYGFKSIKSIVKIEFTKEQPKTLWNELAPDEYGFYANVNPTVDHPRWSQATEKKLEGKLFPARIKTLMFNGYENEVAGLYKGLDLKKNY